MNSGIKTLKKEGCLHMDIVPSQSHTYTEISEWSRVPKEKWDDWRWQLQSVVRSVGELTGILGELSESQLTESKTLSEVIESFEMRITPDTVSNIYRVMKSGDRLGAEALIAMFVPSINEHDGNEDTTDYIGEELKYTKPAPLVTNFYRNRALLFITNICPAYCRFCFRRRKVGNHGSIGIEIATDTKRFHEALEYIRNDKLLREVVVSGGDPLTLNDSKLLSILDQLKRIEHIKVMRIDTKVLTTLPQRITSELVKGLMRFKPLYIVGNFLHPVELTPRVLQATSSLIDAGIPLLSHTALLKGINDNARVISDLMWRLYTNRIIPYYLIQFIPTRWTEHFRVPVQKGLEIMQKLNGRLPGVATPTYIVYLPGGAGKVPVQPNYLLDRTEKGYYFRNFDGKKVLYEEHPEL